MLVENLDVETDALLGRKRVQIPTNRVHLPRNGFRGAVLRSFKNHVFDEMRETVDFRFFVPGAGLDPDADGNGPDVLHLLRDDGQAVRKDVPMNIA